MLLVRKIYVIQQRALSWQKGTRQLKRLSVPVLRLLLLVVSLECRVLLHLQNEPDFRRVTEVGDGHVRHLHYERFSCQLKLILTFFNEVFELEGLELHDVSDTESLEILTLIEISQDVLHIELLALLVKGLVLYLG